MNSGLKGKTFFVTRASGGIGAATAHAFARGTNLELNPGFRQSRDRPDGSMRQDPGARDSIHESREHAQPPDGESPPTVGSSTSLLERPRLQKTHQVLEVFEGVQLSRLVFCQLIVDSFPGGRSGETVSLGTCETTPTARRPHCPQGGRQPQRKQPILESNSSPPPSAKRIHSLIMNDPAAVRFWRPAAAMNCS